jgi:PAS domain S-box-containing protein
MCWTAFKEPSPRQGLSDFSSFAAAPGRGQEFGKGAELMDIVATPEELVLTALNILETGDNELRAALGEINVPLYVTDADGVITYYNPACIAFAGRTPEVRADRWCVTWKLFTRDGVFLPHDHCPMATALKEQRAIRGMTAIAERPDGTRVVFMPYPTPVLKDGQLVGAVNLLIDITDTSRASDLWIQADKARRLARTVMDSATADTLERLAVEYETKAIALGGSRSPDDRLH